MRKLYFFALIISLLFVLAACNDSNETNNNEEIITPVETERMQTGDFVVEKTMYGNISPIKQTPIITQQPGEVTVLHVENGDKVTKDEHLATIQTAMGNQRILSPVDGEIAHLSATEDMFQSNEEPLAIVVDLEKLTVTFSVTAAARGQFEKDDIIKMYIDSQEYKATVRTIDLLPNETGQFIIEAEIDNEARDILPGMIAKIVMTDTKIEDTIIVPSEAIISDNDESYVFIVKDNIAEKVTVEIEETQSDKTAIKADLDKEDQIIVTGHFTLVDGNTVEVVKEGK